ncbi:MAG: hypothetical protein JSU85_14105 [Candidatus Zixiibacteriota bacterium]|nr:MAG: hypothetical protein JSU85_14105 [candidate division Zixibacteria bacterium]
MNWKSALILCGAFCLALLTGCDRRSSTSRAIDELSFSTELSLIKDYSTGRNRADIEFFREGVPYSEAVIKVNGIVIQNAGGSIYFDTLFAPLNTGLATITFESDVDDYLDTLILNLPDSFGVTNMTPSEMAISSDVFVEWSAADGATAYILGVSTLYSPDDGSIPLSILLGGTARSYTIPAQTFEDGIGDEIFGTYYVYLIAFNRGFLPYVGLKFPLPDDVPVRPLAEPSGTAGYGTIAPIDSIRVVF